MKIFKLHTIIFMLFAFLISTPMVSQVRGGRKKEHRNQRGGGMKLFGPKSRGNANAFANRGRNKSFLAKVFGRKPKTGWVYKKTNPGLKQTREQAQLFSRNRTKAKRFNDRVLAQQNRKRTANRVRGSSSFGKRR
jgi:hypothetical protein